MDHTHDEAESIALVRMRNKTVIGTQCFISVEDIFMKLLLPLEDYECKTLLDKEIPRMKDCTKGLVTSRPSSSVMQWHVNYATSSSIF